MRKIIKYYLLSFIAASLLQSNNTYVQNLYELNNQQLTNNSSIRHKASERIKFRNQMIFDKIMRRAKKA